MKHLFKNSHHKILSLIVTLAIVLSGIPLSAAAEDNGPGAGTLGASGCVCDALCGEDNANADCPVCVGDYKQCTYTDAAVASPGTTGSGDGGGMIIAGDGESCVCEALCDADNPNANCPVCADNPLECFHYYCYCETECTGDNPNPDCPVCKDDYTKCAQAVVPPEITPLAVALTDGVLTINVTEGITSTAAMSAAIDAALSTAGASANDVTTLTFTGGSGNTLGGNGVGAGLVTKLPSMTTLDLSGFNGTFGADAFYGCTSITTVKLPADKNISGSMFEGCAGLTTLGTGAETPESGVIDLSGFTGTFGAYAFYGCTSITTVKLPADKAISYGMFQGCTGLTTLGTGTGTPAADVIDLSGFTGTFGTNAFQGCTSITTVKLPADKAISNYMFYGCAGLKAIALGDTPPASFGTAAFTSVSNPMWIINGDSTTSYTIPTSNAPNGAAFPSISGESTINVGGTLTLTVTPDASAATAVTYQWKKDGTDISGETSRTYTKTTAAEADSGSYTCAVSLGGTTYTTAAVAVTVNALPPAITVTNFEGLKAAINGASGDTTIIIGADITITEGLTVPENANITIKSDITTRTLLRGGTALNLITVGANLGGSTAKLTLENITIDGNNANYPSNNSSLVYVINGGEFTMNSGATLQNNTSGDGGGVSNKGTFTMNGGTIYGNTAHFGGGVYNYGGTFNMNGGEISGNTSDYGYGGGVYGSGIFTVGGTAKITGNTGSDGTTPNNVQLGNNIYITLGTPTNGMEIGVTKAVTANGGVFVNSGANASHVPYFHADETGKEVVLDSEKLKIADAVTPITVTNTTGYNKGFTTLQDAVDEIDGISDTINTYTITINEDVTQSGDFDLPTKPVIITGASGKVLTFSGNVTANAAVTFENIIINGNGINFYGNGKNIVFGSGIEQSGTNNTFITVYGGANASAVTGNTSVSIASGKFSSVYGGGIGSGGTVTVDTNVTISGGTVGDVYGGGNGSCTVGGNTNMTISGGTISGSVNGGGNGSGTVTGNTTVTISDGTIQNYINGYSGTTTGTRTLILSGLSGKTYPEGIAGGIVNFDVTQLAGGTSLNITADQEIDGDLTGTGTVKVTAGTLTVNGNMNATLTLDVTGRTNGSTVLVAKADASTGSVTATNLGAGLELKQTTNGANYEWKIAAAATPITSALISVTAPVTGATPDTTTSYIGNFTIGAVSWSPSHNPFRGGTQYTATVTLTAHSGYTFTGLATATINANAATVTNNTGNTVTLSYTFSETAAATVSSISIIQQPTKLNYTHGEALDLSGLIVTVHYNDGTTEAAMNPSEFTTFGGTISPANGATLSHTTHNGQPVTVSFGGKSQNTNTLSVGKATPSGTWPTGFTATYGQALSDISLTGYTSLGSVAGTFTWTTPSNKVGNVGSQSHSMTFTPTGADATNYNTATQNVSVSVSAKALTITGATHTRQYDGTTDASVSIDWAFSGYATGDSASDISVDTYSAEYTSKNAGTTTINVASMTLYGVKGGNYTVTPANNIPVTGGITKKDISIATVAALTKTYDGNATATAGAVTFDVVLANSEMAAGADYTVSSVFTGGDYNAGTSKPYTYTVTMQNTAAANNYNLTGGNTKTGYNGEIDPAPGLTATPHTITILSTDMAAHTYNLDNIALNKSDYGTRSYARSTFSDGGSVLAAQPTLSGTTLTYQGTGQTSGSATQVITITTQNYTDITVTITFTATTKNDISDSSLFVFANGTAVYDGTAKTHETATYDGSGTNITYSYSGTANDSTSYGPTAAAPTKAGNYTVTAKYEDASNIGTKTANFKINARSISLATIAAIGNQTYTGSPIEPTPSVTDSGAVITASDYDVSYSANHTDVGTVTVTLTGKNNYTGTKTATFSITAGALTGTPTITIGGGTLKIGAVLTAGNGSLNHTAGLSYQWKSGGENIIGATSNTYTVQGSDAGKAITVTVTASGNYAGTATSTETAAVLYTVKLGTITGNTTGDSVTLTEVYKNAGDTVDIGYTLANTAIVNKLALGNGLADITTPATSTVTYTVAASHAVGGVITFNPVFTHQSELTTANVTVTPPAKGQTPQNSIAAGSYYTGTITWNPADSAFKGGKEYTATITLTATGGATFANNFVPTVSGGTVNGVSVASGGSVTFTVTYSALQPREVTSIAVTTQPSKTTYYSGDTLSVAGLEVTATYDDGTTGPVAPSSYAIDGKSFTPGTTLLTGAQNNKPITVKFGSETATTGNITVKSPPAISNVTVTGITSTGATISYTATQGTDAIASQKLEYRTGSGNWTTATNGSAITGLTPDTVYQYRITVSDGTKEVSRSGSFQTPKSGSTGVTVEGTVTDNTNPTNVIVTIEHGNTVIASVTVSGSGTYSFSFSNIPNGIYNLVADNGSYKVTQAVTVSGNDVTGVSIVMTQGNTQSVVDIVTPDTPPAAVDGLPDLFTDSTIYTSDDEAVVAASGTVEIKLAVEQKDAPSDANIITGAASGQDIGLYLDLSVIKSQFDSAGALLDETKLTNLGSNLITITFELPDDLKGKAGLTIYRVHSGVAEALPFVPSTNASGESADISDGIVTLTVCKFSTYAIAFTPSNPPSPPNPPSNGGGSSSGGGSSGGGTASTIVSTYWIELAEAKTMAKDAKDKGLDYVRSRRAGITGIRKNALIALTGLRYQHDTVADSAVQVRVYVDDPAQAAKDILVSGYVKGVTVNNVKAKFEKWFTNKVAVVSFDQQGDFGMKVQIAAKVDLTGMDTNNLYFYGYDRKANKYTRIQTEYRIDSNGYLHFATILAGDIIVSSGPLSKKAVEQLSETDKKLYYLAVQSISEIPNDNGGDSMFSVSEPPMQEAPQNPSTGGEFISNLNAADTPLTLEKVDNQTAGGALVFDLDAPLQQDAFKESLKRDKISVYVVMGITSVLLIAAIMLWAAIPRKDDPIVSVEEYRRNK